MLAQKPPAEAVERRDPGLVVGIGEAFVYPLLDLGRCAGGERQDQDLAAASVPVFDELGVTRHEGVRLACAGAGQDSQWPRERAGPGWVEECGFGQTTFWYGGGVDSYVEYHSQIDLHIRAAGTNAPLFDGRAQARSETNRLDVVVPSLVEAMFTGFPGRSGEVIKITIPTRPPARS